MLVSAIIKSSMRVAQVLRQGEDPEDQEMTDALEALTIMLHSWAARRLLTRANTVEPFTLAASTSSFYIGVGQTFNTSKPSAIMKSILRDTESQDTDVDVYSMEEYNSIPDKIVSTGRPSVIAYDPGYAQQATQKGTVYVYPMADVATYSLRLNQQKPFTEYTAITDTLTFDSPYEEAIKYELALRIWREYHKTDIPGDILRDAAKAMAIIETMNAPRVIADLSRVGGGGGGAYNITTG